MKLAPGKDVYKTRRSLWKCKGFIRYQRYDFLLQRVHLEHMTELKQRTATPTGPLRGLPVYFAMTPYKEVIFYPAPDKWYSAHFEEVKP